jgi:dephospho-CoA kinase
VLRVGLTGNIASGKSSVARVWRRLGGTVIDADELARLAVAPGTRGLSAIRARWGDAVLTPDGGLDRAALRDIVFADPSQRAALEAIVHPEVARLREQRLEEAERSGAPLAVSDIPLLFEVGLQGEFDRIVLVDAPESVRRERLVRDRDLSVEAADRMIAAQMPAREKRSRAHMVIENAGTMEELERTAHHAWERLLGEATAR